LKGDRYSLSRAEFLIWLAAILGSSALIAASAATRIAPPSPKNARAGTGGSSTSSRPLPSPTCKTPADSPLPFSDRLFVLDIYRPIFQKVRRKHKPRKTGVIVPISPLLEPAA